MKTAQEIRQEALNLMYYKGEVSADQFDALRTYNDIEHSIRESILADHKNREVALYCRHDMKVRMMLSDHGYKTWVNDGRLTVSWTDYENK